VAHRSAARGSWCGRHRSAGSPQGHVPHSDLFVATNTINANQHGVDSSPRGVESSRAEGQRLRDLPDAQGATLARKRFRFRVLSRLLTVTLVAAWAVVLLVI